MPDGFYAEAKPDPRAGFLLLPSANALIRDMDDCE